MLNHPIYKPKYQEYIKRKHSLICELCKNHSPIAAAIIEQFELYPVNKRYINSIKATLLQNPYTRHIIYKNIKSQCIDVYSRGFLSDRIEIDEITDVNPTYFVDLLYEHSFHYYDIYSLEKDFNTDNIDWYRLSIQPDAIGILEKYPDRIVLEGLLSNTNPKAMTLAKKIFSHDKIFGEMFNLLNVYSKNWCTGASIFMKGHICYSRGFLSDRIEIKIIGNPNGAELLEYYSKPFYKYSILPEILRKPNLLHLLFTWDYEKMKQNNWNFKEDLVKYILNPKRILNICDLYNIEFDELMEMYHSI
jgi:hypothetical protein